MYQFLVLSRLSSSRLPISGILIIPSFSGVLVFLFLGLFSHSLDVSSGKVACGESLWRWQLLKACLAFCSSMDQDPCAGPCLHAAPARLSQVYVLAPEMPFQEDGLAPATFSQATEGRFLSSWGRGRVDWLLCQLLTLRSHRHKPWAPNLFLDIILSRATTLYKLLLYLWLLHLSSESLLLPSWFPSDFLHALCTEIFLCFGFQTTDSSLDRDHILFSFISLGFTL